MNNIEKLLKGNKYICFLDFEGTQFSHEMIALGAIFVSLDRFGRIKKEKEPFKLFVKPKNRIGTIVKELTGITDEQVEKEGVSFKVALEKLKKYIGVHFLKCSFITYGNHDMKILSESISHNLEFPKEICYQIRKNYIDFGAFFAEYVKDAKGNNLSLIHACELFGVDIFGPAHDPAADAINLARLYDAFLKERQIVEEKYWNNLKYSIGRYPVPIQKALRKLLNHESVTKEEFEEFMKGYLK